jgi:hypothetical protein
VVAVAEFQELSGYELGAIVSYDGVWYPDPMDNVCEEQHSLLGPEAADGAGLDPFRELVDCYQQVGEAPWCLPQVPDEV